MRNSGKSQRFVQRSAAGFSGGALAVSRVSVIASLGKTAHRPKVQEPSDGADCGLEDRDFASGFDPREARPQRAALVARRLGVADDPARLGKRPAHRALQRIDGVVDGLDGRRRIDAAVETAQ